MVQSLGREIMSNLSNPGRRIFLLLALLAFASGCTPQKSPPLKIGVVPAQTEGEMAKGMQRLQELLAKKLGREVTVEVYPEYNGVVEALNYQKLDVAFLGPFTYVVANKNSGARAIVTQLINGEPYYFSYLITPANSKLQSIDDLKASPAELKLMFGSINSTSGCLVPSAELKDLKLYVDENHHSFKEVKFGGSHDVVALSIQNGTADIGAIDSALFDSFVRSGKVDATKVRVIWKSEKLFQYPWAVRSGLDSTLEEKIQAAFLAIDDPLVFKAFEGATKFVECSDDDYNRIRQIAKKLGKL
jgi:phosphonate transport system substrate-binding protein